MEQYLRVGVIASTHGLKGEVKVFPTTDEPERFRKLKKVFLDTGKEYLPLKIKSVKFFKNQVILKFDEFQDINEVEKYRGKDLLIDREQALPLAENEKSIVVELRVAPSDMGKVIGKQGRIAKAIRSVVKAAASKEEKKVIVEIMQ